MKRSRIFSLGMLAAWMAGAALADWRGISVPGTPLDVEISDAGYFAVGTNIGVAGDAGFSIVVPSDGGALMYVASLPAPLGDPVASAYVDSAGCLSGYLKSSGANLGCAAQPIPVGGGNSLVRIRHLPDGAAYAAEFTGATPPTYYFQPNPAAAWVPFGSPTFGSAPGLGVLRLGNFDYGLFGRKSPSLPFLSANGGAATFYGDPRISTVNAVALFGLGSQPRGLYGGLGGLDLTDFTATPPAPVLNAADITDVAFQSATGARGEGFGMAIAPSADAGGLVIFNAVPDPAALAQRWVPNTALLTLPTYQLTNLACWGATFCVLWGNATGPAVNVVTYYNAHAPSIVPSGLGPLTEGQSGLISVTANDGDGDAVFVTWDVDGGGSPLALLGQSGSSIEVDAGFIGCQWTAIVPLEVRATDGLHTTTAAFGVEIDRPLSVLADAGFALDGEYDPVASMVRGDAGIDACFNRSDLTADLTLSTADGGGLRLETIPVPGGWSFPLARTCQATDYSVVGGLRVDGGTYATASFSFTSEPLTADFDHLSTGTLQAVCGQPAQAKVTVELDAGNCPTESFAWRALPGSVSFQIYPQAGPFVSISTSDASFDSLIGQTVTVELTIDAGSGSGRVVDLTLPIVPSAPFVEVDHLTDRAIALDEALVGIEVTLTNTSACAVSNTQYQELLQGARYVAGTARVEGQPVEARPSAASDGSSSLIFDGLNLDGGGQLHLSYSVRPALLGPIRVSGTSTLRGVPLSDGGSLSPGQSVSCGCSSGASGTAAWGLLLVALTAALRRRSRNRS